MRRLNQALGILGINDSKYRFTSCLLAEFFSSAVRASFFPSCISRGFNRGMGADGSVGGTGGCKGLMSLATNKYKIGYRDVRR